MTENGFTQIITSGCLYSDAEGPSNGSRRPQRRVYHLQPELRNEPRAFPQYGTSSGGDVRRMLPDQGGAGKRFETTVTSIDGEWNMDDYEADHGEPRERERRPVLPPKHETFDCHGYMHPRSLEVPAVRLKVAHQEPISIRPRNKNPQIVNVCQTFRFPDNFITQNNANRVAQHQDQLLHQGRPIPDIRRPSVDLLSSCHTRSRLGGIFGVYRRHRNMHSQTSRTLLELVESEQQPKVPKALPRTTMNYNVPAHPRPEDVLLTSSGSETSIDEPIDVRPRLPQVERQTKAAMNRDNHGRAGNGRASHVPYFDRTKRNRSCTKLVHGGATMGGHYGRSSKLPGTGAAAKQTKYLAKPKPDHRRTHGEDALDSPFVGDPHVSIANHNRKSRLAEEPDSLDDEDDEEVDDSDLDPIDEQEHDREEDNEQDDLEDEDEEEPDGEASGDAFGHRRSHGVPGDSRVIVSKDGSVGISGIVDKLQDNVWEVCLEGIWDLMDMASRIDWKAQEKYITVINRKLIEFLKSPRTALCRSACQMSGELFRQAKSTKRPEFDEMVDILLCKTADPNRFIQKDANVALDKLVTYIPTPHTVRAISNRGTIHRNPLVRTATARLLVCICVVSGLDAILGTTANTRTRKTILSMLAKFLTDKNLETRKFGERLYRMLRKHKFFDEYFYKDMDNNLRTNLKRALKGI